MDFLSEDEIDQRVQTQAQSALKWRELSIGVIYRIDRVKPITTRYGPATILELMSRDNTKIEVWAPDRLVKELRWSEMPRYIRSLGLV